MASAYSGHRLSCHLGRSYRYLVIVEFLFLFISLPLETNSLSFEFASFDQSSPGVDLQGDAFISDSQIHLTNDFIRSYGRALYPKPIQLWDATPKRLTDFTTNFTFSTAQLTPATYGDGLTFLLVPENTQIPTFSGGGCLALFSSNENRTGCVFNQTVVAIEFDTFQNLWDPDPLTTSNLDPFDHIGIDVNSVKSSVYANVSVGLKNNTVQALVSYDSTTKNLSVSISINQGSVPFSVSLSYLIDLSTVLPQWVQVGFSAGTGDWTELNKIHAWSFNSNLEETVAPSPAPTPQQDGAPGKRSTKKGKGGLVAGIAVGVLLILVFGVVIGWVRLRRNNPGEINTHFDFGEDFSTGPKGFTFGELSQATNNFAKERKLGEGGFGGVYKGLLAGPRSREVAVKKIKSGSSQGRKEYIAEVKIISRLRHRNLVQLLGWCHERGELLLVYEFMPNRSLDVHLFGRKTELLSWPTRYEIALGLASALRYLHEEGGQSVVHRDIKSSNVMLDSNFNPKLGDFGLARLSEHNVSLQTTEPAGTLGYLAPECLLGGKASKESDVYSFGIVALELACGRKVIEPSEDDSRVNLPEWVWGLYGLGRILEAVDNRLEGKFDEEQAKCLMVVGLWCSHPEDSHRPSIKQAMDALNPQTTLRSLPPQRPWPQYDRD